jgi:hypothetical protein
LLPWVSHLRTSAIAAARNPERTLAVQPNSPNPPNGGDRAP